ncbi:MAG: hypothetical protein JXA79_13465 [Deltaproteobacteria bacterium]|nr:hypothetical protein [Deltaproteobacteria bacterium]
MKFEGNIPFDDVIEKLGRKHNQSGLNPYTQSLPTWDRISSNTPTNSTLPGNLAYVKTNLAATNEPTYDDDLSAGYSLGSRWINISEHREWVCVDATTGRAVWQETTSRNARYLDNERGSYYSSRFNHTGTQDISTIEAFRLSLTAKLEPIPIQKLLLEYLTMNLSIGLLQRRWEQRAHHLESSRKLIRMTFG